MLILKYDEEYDLFKFYLFLKNNYLELKLFSKQLMF